MLKRCITAIAAIAAPLLWATPALADVERSDSDGFALVIDSDSATDADLLWQRMVTPARWWNRDHTWSGDATNMHLDARAGGCWCEAVSGGGSVAHGMVVAIEPARHRVLMRSELGPLQGMAVNGWLEWRVSARTGGGSHVRWHYTVQGHGIDATGELARAVDAVLTEQVTRLVAQTAL